MRVLLESHGGLCGAGAADVDVPRANGGLRGAGAADSDVPRAKDEDQAATEDISVGSMHDAPQLPTADVDGNKKLPMHNSKCPRHCHCACLVFLSKMPEPLGELTSYSAARTLRLELEP